MRNTSSASSATSELFTQLQRLSSLQSLIKLLEDEQGPPPQPEDDAGDNTEEGYLPVAKMLLKSYEQSCRFMKYFNLIFNNNNNNIAQDGASSTSSFEQQHRAIFSAIVNINEEDEQDTVSKAISFFIEKEQDEKILENDDDDEQERDLKIASIIFSNNNNNEHGQQLFTSSFLQSLHTNRESHKQRLVDLDDDVMIDDEPLLPYETEDHIFDLLSSKLGGSSSSSSSINTIDMIMKKALQRGVLTMINKQAEEQVERQLQARDKKLAEEQRKADDFNRNLLMKGANSSAKSSGNNNNSFDDGLGINIDEEDAFYDDDNDGEGENKNKMSNQIEIERLDMEPRFLKSMGVSFRDRIEEARRARQIQELEQKKLKAQSKRTGISASELKQSKEKFLIDRQQQRLERAEGVTNQDAAQESSSSSLPKQKFYLSDLNSMQLALKKRAQVLKEQRSYESRYLLSGGGNANNSSSHNNNADHHANNNEYENNESKRKRDFGESINADDSGASLHLTLQKYKDRKEHQNNNNNSNKNRFQGALLPTPGSIEEQELIRQHQQQQESSSSTNKNNIPLGWMSKTVSINNDQEGNNNERKLSAFEEIQRQRASLPIAPFEQEIVRIVRSQRTNVLTADTGSGKTTQVARYLHDAGFCNVNNTSDENNTNNNRKLTKKIIACTQPRLIAAKTVAARVAEEFGCQVGEQVGYTVRFDDCTSPLTVIKYMTDGVLLREALMDDSFSRYSVIILDEAHERNLNTDILFALCKKAVAKNPDLTIVATSATLDSDKFCEYFGCEQKIEIPGRTFPVERIWLSKPCEDYFEEAIETVMKIHIQEKPGDILVFLTGKEEIETAKKRLDRYMESEELRDKVRPLIVTRLYAGLPDEDKAKALEKTPAFSRKVILSTNIAETSVTIDGLYYVVDSGYHKQNVYNPKNNVETLAVVPIARSQAKQRCGRAGRTGPGKCYFLYTEQQFWSDMVATSIPEIQRVNLANVVLTLKAIGFNNILSLDFMDPPPVDALVNALEHLYFLSALDQDGVLTNLGGRMSQLPVSPNESRSLLTALELGCLEPVLTIVAMLGEQHIFIRPKERQEEADRARLGFAAAEGDHITLLRVWEACYDQQFSVSWMKLNFINPNAISRCKELRNQLMNLLKKNLQRDREVQLMLEQNKSISGATVRTNSNNNSSSSAVGKTFNTKFDLVKVRKAIIAGYFYHAARRNPNQTTEYSSLTDKRTVHMNPNCVLFHSRPKFVVYHELLETTREYMRECIAVNPAWLLEMAPNFFSSPGAGKKTEDMKRQRIDPILRAWESHGSGANTWRISRLRAPRTK